MFLRRALILLKLLQLGRVHMLHHMVRLPLLEVKPQPLMRVIFIVRLILMILDLHEIAIQRRGVQAQRHQAGDRGGFRDELEGPGLLVLELDELVIGADYLVRLVDGGVEELGEREPLACHFVAVVGIHELVIVDTVSGVALYSLHGGLAGVEGDNLSVVSLGSLIRRWKVHHQRGLASGGSA